MDIAWGIRRWKRQGFPSAFLNTEKIEQNSHWNWGGNRWRRRCFLRAFEDTVWQAEGGRQGMTRRKQSARPVGETWRGPVRLSPSTGRRIKGDKAKSLNTVEALTIDMSENQTKALKNSEGNFFKCIIQQLSVYSYCWVSIIIVNFRTFRCPKKKPHTPNHHPLPTSTPYNTI